MIVNCFKINVPVVDINHGEEMWSGSDDEIETLDLQAFDGDVGAGLSREVKLITCLLHFIVLFQAKFYIAYVSMCT